MIKPTALKTLVRNAMALSLIMTTNISVASNTIEGVWITADNDSLIEFQVQDDKLVGLIAGSISDPEHNEFAGYDENNPDPGLRDRSLHRLAIFTGLRASGSKKWKCQVYDPSSGKTYRCTLTVVDNDTLKVRGYVGLSILGRTQVWTRLAN